MKLTSLQGHHPLRSDWKDMNRFDDQLDLVADLQKMTKRLESLALKRSYSDYLTLNIEFHLFFARKTGSGELLEAISQLRKRIFRFAYAQVMIDHLRGQYLKDHQDLIDALRGKIKEKPEKNHGKAYRL